MEHPPYSPDLAPCDFFLFGYIKGKLVGKQYETPENLISEVRNIIKGIRPDVLKSIFEFCKGRLLDCWIAGLLDCWSSGGEYVE
jgi:hypothetical protein